MRAKHVLPILLLLFFPAASRAADVQGDWRRLGPEGGSVSELVAAPSDSRVLYALVEGRLHRSADGGTSWTETGLDAGIFNPSANLAVDAVESSKVYINVGVNIIRSFKGGEPVELIAPVAGVNNVAAHPRRGGFVFAATDSGLFRSADSGTTWQALRGQGLPQTYRAVRVFTDPYFPSRVFVSIVNRALKRRFFKSLDAGLTWKAIDGGVLQQAYPAIEFLATDPRNPKTLHASDGAWMYRSADAGATWKKLAPPIGAGTLQTLAVLPNQPQFLYYGGGIGLFRSRDGGANWERVEQGFPEDGGIHALAASSGSLLAGVSSFLRRGGVFRSLDGGTSWSFSSPGILATTVTSIEVGEPGTLWVVANAVLFRSTDRGQTWSRIRPGPPSNALIFRVVVDPLDRSNVYVAMSDREIRRSGDAGETWEVASRLNDPAFRIGLVIDPQTPSTLYAFGNRLWKSTDRGTTWTQLVTPGGFFVDLAVSPKSPSTLYTLGSGQEILRSTDGGAHWSAPIVFPPDVIVSSIAVDPLLPQTVYVGTLQGVYRTKDGGETWTRFSNAFEGLEIYPIEISAQGALYAGVSFDKLYTIRDGDNAWSALEGSGRWSFTTLAFDPHDPCRIYVGARGQSLLEFTKSGTPECPGEP